MGERGPIPAPDNVRAIRGMKPLKDSATGEKARRLVLPPVAPAPPKGLSRAASAEWRRVVPELERAGVLNKIDRGILVAYVTAWAHMHDAEEILKEEGLLVAGRDGNRVRNPAWLVYKEAASKMIAAARECYLTPTSRLRIPVPQGVAADDGTADDLFD